MFIDNLEVVTHGRLVKIAALRNEWYDFPKAPDIFLKRLRESPLGADVFTFLQQIPDRDPKYTYHRDVESIAVLPLTTYDEWWKKQISDKTRNIVRKAAKKGLEIRVAEFDDKFLHGIKQIYDEVPIRQGKHFWHYKKDLESLRKMHVTYLNQTQFVAAYLGDELVGFIKLVHHDGIASFMQIISKTAHRDKGPNNAMIAKAVEICTSQKTPFVIYGSWSRRGLGEFKKNHGFERFDMPRYFVPLTPLGAIATKLKLYRKVTDYIPDRLLDAMLDWRGRFLSYRYKTS